MTTSVTTAAALTCTGLISLVPNLILFFFPNYNSDGGGSSSLFLNLGQALAAGGLIGDVFLHTLSHVQGEDAGIYILLGFTVFLAVDMMIRSMDGDGHGHVHSHSHAHGACASNSTTTTTTNSKETIQTNGQQEKKHEDGHFHSVWFSSTVLLNLGADALHNFTDGVAIGASFAVNGGGTPDDSSVASLLYSRGGLVALSVLFHEVPHELGDYCVLVSRGLSKRQAILAQFATAIAALVGTLAGTVGASSPQHGDQIVLLTAGGFLYLASVNILPEVLNEGGSSLQLKLAQLCAFGAGIGFMQLVSVLEEHDHDHHLHGHAHHHHHHYVQEEVPPHHHDHHHDHGHHHEL